MTANELIDRSPTTTNTINKPFHVSDALWDALISERHEQARDAGHRAFPAHPVSRALYQLASYHAHGWTSYATPDGAGGLDMEATSAAMSAAEDAGDHHTPGGAGLRPALSHTTGTGRISWRLDPLAPAGPTLTIRCHRPVECLGVDVRLDGDVIVAEVVATLGDRPSVRNVYVDEERCEGRHLLAIADVARACEIYVDAFARGSAAERVKWLIYRAREEAHGDDAARATAALWLAELYADDAAEPAALRDDVHAAAIEIGAL